MRKENVLVVGQVAAILPADLESNLAPGSLLEGFNFLVSLLFLLSTLWVSLGGSPADSGSAGLGS